MDIGKCQCHGPGGRRKVGRVSGGNLLGWVGRFATWKSLDIKEGIVSEQLNHPATPSEIC